MNREEMLERLKAGYEPIDVAIEKWRDIVADPRITKDCFGGDDFVLDEADSNCALCHVFRDGKDDCGDCPIIKAGFHGCAGGVYKKASEDNNPQLMLDELLRVKAWLDAEKCKETDDKPEEKIKEQTYSMGQRFKSRCGEYILAHVGHGKVMLICLVDGNWWDEGSDVDKITKIKKHEIQKWFNDGFELIDKEVKK